MAGDARDAIAPQVNIEFASASQAEAFFLWMTQQGAAETFMEADVSAELPDSLTKAKRPTAEDPVYRFKFE